MTPERRRKALGEVGGWLFSFAVVYVAGSFVAFRVRHPWLTETQVLMHTAEALTWRTVDR